MNNDPQSPQLAPPPGGGPWAAAEPYLDQARQAVLTAIEEAIRRHGSELLASAKETLKAALDGLVRVQVEKMVEQLKPGGETARGLTEGWLRELREFANTTVRDLFEKRVPEYSRWAGQRVIDYTLVGVLFALGAVLLFVGGVLGLQRAGVPPYVTCLTGGAGAMVLGFGLLKLRSRRWETPPANGNGEAAKPPGG